MSISLKKSIYIIISMITVICMCIMPTQARGRKLITKSVSGSFSWTFYDYNYSFNAVAGITYNDSNNITQISDLLFSNIVCNSSSMNFPGSIVPRQSSKYFTSSSATYVVTVTRNAYGMYADKVDYTLIYRPSDPGTPYSLNQDKQEFEVEIVEGEPYDIQISQQ